LFCGNEARQTRPSAKKHPEFQKAFDDKGKRIRGLWLRDGTFYAPTNASGQKQQYKYRLQARTVPTPLRLRKS
jgi:hypothetical protein